MKIYTEDLKGYDYIHIENFRKIQENINLIYRKKTVNGRT